MKSTGSGKSTKSGKPTGSGKARQLLGALVLFVGWSFPLGAIDLFVHSPREGQVVFGTVEVALEVLSAAPVEEVSVELDGVSVARLTKPPYRVQVEVGEENRPRHFTFTVRDIHGEEATRALTTGAIQVHEEVDLGLQQLYVTVSKESGRVLDLGERAFEVLDGDTTQELVTFERGSVPLTAVLLIDSSLSMRGAALRDALAGARKFVEGMQDLDEAKVLVFSDRLLATTDFTSDPAEVEKVMDSVGASGGTAVNDHLYLALADLDEHQGRRVLILLSDGVDVESVLTMEDVRWKAQRTQTLVYWIRPSGSGDASGGHFSIWRDAAGYQQELSALAEVVETSGGRAWDIGRAEEVAPVLQEVLQELREQYVLGYYPSLDLDDGAWREVRVKVRKSGAKVRARGGYFDDPP